MPLASLEPLMALVVGQLRPRVLVVTTPNADFNRFFNLEPGQLRHPDHKYELTSKEFAEWAHGLATDQGYTLEFDGTRYPVEGHPEAAELHCSQAAIFTKIQKQEEEEIGSSTYGSSSGTQESPRRPSQIEVTTAHPLLEVSYPCCSSTGGRRVAEVIFYAGKGLTLPEVPSSFYQSEEDWD